MHRLTRKLKPNRPPSKQLNAACFGRRKWHLLLVFDLLGSKYNRLYQAFLTYHQLVESISAREVYCQGCSGSPYRDPLVSWKHESSYYALNTLLRKNSNLRIVTQILRSYVCTVKGLYCEATTWSVSVQARYLYKTPGDLGMLSVWKVQGHTWRTDVYLHFCCQWHEVQHISLPRQDEAGISTSSNGKIIPNWPKAKATLRKKCLLRNSKNVAWKRHAYRERWGVYYVQRSVL